MLSATVSRLDDALADLSADMSHERAEARSQMEHVQGNVVAVECALAEVQRAHKLRDGAWQSKAEGASQGDGDSPVRQASEEFGSPRGSSLCQASDLKDSNPSSSVFEGNGLGDSGSVPSHGLASRSQLSSLQVDLSLQACEKPAHPLAGGGASHSCNLGDVGLGDGGLGAVVHQDAALGGMGSARASPGGRMPVVWGSQHTGDRHS